MFAFRKSVFNGTNATNFHLSFATIAFLAAAVATAEDQQPKSDPSANGNNRHEFATRPEGAVLPASIARVRFIYTSKSGQGVGYDSDGNKQDTVIDVSGRGGALVLEYGITDELSLQINQKFVASYDVSINEDRALEQTAETRAASKAALNSAICTALSIPSASCTATLASAKPTAAQAAALNANSTLQSSAKGISFDTNTAIGTTISSYVDGAIGRSKTAFDGSGAKGLSELEVGVLYKPYGQETLHWAVAGGFRHPWNKSLADVTERAITRSAPEAAVRVNVDYQPIVSTDIAWQNQSEVGISSASYSSGDVSSTYTRKGVRNQGFLIVKQSLADLNPSLAMFGPMLGVTYDFDNELCQKMSGVDEEIRASRGYEMRYYAATNLNFFDFGPKVNLLLEYEKSFRGKNVAVATDKTQVQLKTYARF
jgi:hypothetical protein